jgi:serine/threonine protein kinase/O-acetyl-ADP-ribose deacetylase (regulator of RNase III)
MPDPSPEQLSRVAEAVERFECAWRRGDRPRIKDHLDGAPPSGRDELLRHLIRVELELRRGAGESPCLDDYTGDWPDHAGLVGEIFATESTVGRDTGTLDHPTTVPSWELPEATSELPGLPGYRVVGVVGRGAMGVVHKVWQVPLERFVAVKTILPGASVDRFHREAKLIAQIASPYVVSIFDLHALPDGRHALVMEFVEGTDLAHVLRSRGGPIPEAEAFPWMRQVAEGMLAAAERKIIHRDLKPSNILIDRRGRARVSDFGLARGPQGFTGDLTRFDDVLGTPFYMAPEQAEDPQGVDTRGDIYSFGATFYHVLTGAPPFDGRTAFSILFKHKTEPLDAPRARNPAISERTGELLERCLAKSPGDRFPSFAQLLEQLEPKAGRDSPWEPSDDPRLEAAFGRYREYRDAFLGRGDLPDGAGRFEFPGGRSLTILRGDITAQRVDAVVSSDNSELTMAIGVSRAIRLSAGPEVAESVRRFAPVRPGRSVVTSGGRLDSRFIFHGVTLGVAGGGFIPPSRDLITEIITSCFYHADTLNVRSIAFPLFGTGGGGFSRAVCLDTTFRTLARTLLNGLTCVQDARIVIFPIEASW